MSAKPYKDQSVRDKIAKELDKSFFVEAGAGSGKTHSLVERMTGIIRHGHASIDTLAAVTFTRKAAAELRQRFQIELENILHDAKTPDKERDAIADALSSFERASISTVHSFCARILRERPIEAGIDPGFEEVEEEDDNIFASEVWAEYLERQGFENSKTIWWMYENGINPSSLKSVYLKLKNYPDVEIFREAVKRPDFTEAKKVIEKAIRRMGKELAFPEPKGGWDDVMSMLRRCLKLFSLGYLKEDRLFVEILKILDSEMEIKPTKWPDRAVGEACLDELTKLRDDVVRPCLMAWREYLHKPLMDFAMGGVEYYERWRTERSILNFQDLLMRTANLLKKNEEVRRYFKHRITHLLVDEFQDTDPIQAEIVLLLTGDDDSVNDWRKVKPRPGSLFLVGDPKQSIFRFRRADIDIYNQVKKILKKSGEILELTSNFRSLECVRDITNEVFSGIFPETDTRHQAKFAQLVTTREASDKYLSGVFENPIGKVYYDSRWAAAEVDAPNIAAWIHHAVNGGLKLERTDKEKKAGETDDAKPGDFMIITKAKDTLPIYAKALERLGVPYELSGGENFSSSEEIYEIYKVLKAAADPKNPVAVVAALRGLYFGASDDDLYAFARAGGRFSYFSEPKAGPAIIKRAFERLREYNAIAESDAPVMAIEKIVEKLGALPLAMSDEMGSSRAGNILKAIELLRGQKPDNTGSFAELVDYLNELRSMKGMEEMSLFPGTAKAVRIMNLHKAKGLEASVVILADPAAALGNHEQYHHVVREESRSVGYFTLTKSKGDYHSEFIALPRGWDGYATEEQHYERAEKERLDYVAVTRAKNILIVGTYHEGAKVKIWQSLYGYLARMPKFADIPKGRGASGKKKMFKITAAQWKDEKKKIETDLEKIKAESYKTVKVTELVEKPDVFVGESSGGMDWGNIVHESLELCGRGRRDKLEAFGQRLLEENGRPATELEKLVKAVDKAMQSDLWKRMAAVKEKYFEVPFSGMDKDTVVRGVIDMIFKEPDGWVIIDYKTGDFEKSPDVKKQYEDQLKMYEKFWTEISGEKVKEKTLLRV